MKDETRKRQKRDEKSDDLGKTSYPEATKH